jgi:hypothetical protein
MSVADDGGGMSQDQIDHGLRTVLHHQAGRPGDRVGTSHRVTASSRNMAVGWRWRAPWGREPSSPCSSRRIQGSRLYRQGPREPTLLWRWTTLIALQRHASARGDTIDPESQLRRQLSWLREPWLWIMQHRVIEGKGQTALDVGCGPGLVMELFSPCLQATGLDIDTTMVKG